MKTIILAVALFLTGMGVEAANTTAIPVNSVFDDPKWKKSDDGTWMGAKKTWYKLDPKDASVWMSKDGKKWEAAKDGMWQDKESHWLKIVDNDLKWSADGGKTWASVPEWKWQGHDGKWYKFDKDWTLWKA